MFCSGPRPGAAVYLWRGPPIFPRSLFRRISLQIVKLIRSFQMPGLQLPRGEVVIRSGRSKNLLRIFRRASLRVDRRLTETRQQHRQRQSRNDQRAHCRQIVPRPGKPETGSSPPQCCDRSSVRHDLIGDAIELAFRDYVFLHQLVGVVIRTPVDDAPGDRAVDSGQRG